MVFMIFNSRMQKRFLNVIALFILFAQVNGFADDVDYLTQIKPLLKTKCFSCHGVIKQEANLRLDSKELMSLGGDSGPALSIDDPMQSLVLKRITGDEFTRMPPTDEGSALKPSEIDLLRTWIEQGANAPEEEIVENPLDHWAFRPILKPADQSVSIDSILEKQRVTLGLVVQPEAHRSLLIRRLYLDLIGLPPSLEQLQDERTWEEIVDDLLASPHYGERWGRHWMDIWRYSDWYGLGAQLRYSQKHLWHWRDWIVDSLNEDKGYDQMVLEMLAGDELAPENLEVVAATGFLARNYYLFNRTTWLDSTIEHTGKAFLGLTLNCAKCHDHKYDPISQQDYYNFRAIFEPHQVRLDPIDGELNLEKDGLPRVFDDHLDAKTFLHIKGDPSHPDEAIEIAPRVPELFADFQFEVEPVNLPLVAYAPALRQEVVTALRTAKINAVDAAEKELKNAQEKANSVPQETSATQNQLADSSFSFFDDFNQPRPEVWEITGSDWKYAGGKLVRTTSTRNPETVRFRGKLPQDFEVTCQYTTTGGATYKSVTFRFDQAKNRSYDNFVYTSAHAPGPKVQAAYTRDGKTTYPPNGRANQPIEVGKEYSLRFAIKGNLLNVWLDDEFVLAYTYPDRKSEGSFSLSGFDSTVAFNSISIRSLPADFKIRHDNSSSPSSEADPVLALKIAKSNLAIAQTELDSFEKTLLADRAILEEKTPAFNANERKLQAAMRQAELSLFNAQHELLLAKKDQKKIDAANKKISAAQKNLEKAKKGQFDYANLKVSQKALETPAHQFDEYSPVYPAQSTGRRRSLAKWIVDKRNPLTARVAVNHIWLRHFGKPLVDSVFDFGLRADVPKQLELLDYLAWEFMESGWSMKYLHRLIVTSQTYRLSSSTRNADEVTLLRDMNNDHYWRMNSRRMESQIIRDALLHIAGVLDTQLGGPSLEVGNKSRRRSIYFKHSRDQQDKFLTMFDDADLLQCYRRDESIVPQQALAMANSQLSLEMSETIAKKIESECESNSYSEFINHSFESILSRKPIEEELKACKDYLDDITKLVSNTSVQEREEVIRTRFVHLLLNHNDFISIR